MRNFGTLVCCLYFLIGPGGLGLAQSPEPPFAQVEHIGQEAGLPARDILTVVTDHRGFLWVTTAIGVFRYDGYRFTSLTRLTPDPGLLTTGRYRLIATPDAGLLLIAPEGKYWLLDTDTYVLHPHPLHRASGRDKLPHDLGERPFQKDGSLVFEVRQDSFLTLYRYSAARGLQCLDRIRQRYGRLIQHVVIVQDQVFWTTNEAGFRHYDAQGRLVDSLEVPIAAPAAGDPRLSMALIRGRGDSLLFRDVAAGVIRAWDWQHHRVTEGILPDLEVVLGPTVEEDGNLWISLTDGKLVVLDARNQPHYLDNRLADLTSYSLLLPPLRDRHGLIWIGSDNGLFRIDAQTAGFRRYLYDPTAEWGRTTRGFFTDPAGRVCFRCENCGNRPERGLYCIDPGTDRAVPYPLTGHSDNGYRLLLWTKIFLGRPGTAEVWTAGVCGLLRMDLTDRSIAPVPAVSTKDLLVPGMAQAPLAMLPSGSLIAGRSLHGLIRYDPATGEVTPLGGGPSGRDRDDNHVLTLAPAYDGNVWLGMRDGIAKVDAESGRVLLRFARDTLKAPTLNHVYALHEDTDGSVWAGTVGNGLVHLQPADGSAKAFTQVEGLANDIVAAILPDGPDRLWISTFSGLSCLDKRDGSFRNFYQKDGLTHNEFNFFSAFIDPAGRYYFGGMNGVNAFYPSEILRPAAVQALPVITGLSYYDTRRDSLFTVPNGWGRRRSVTLSPYVSWFQLDFVLPDFTDPANNRFRTWLEGYEADWSAPVTSPFIRYNSLPAGDYTLHVRASDPRGNWLAEELAVGITVRQKFYRTWWFALVILTVLGAGAYALLRYRFRQQLALERMRTRIAGDLHDEVGSSLSLLSLLIGSFDVAGAPERTAGAAAKSQAVIARTASNVRDIVWAIDARRDRAGDLLDRMEDFAYDMLTPRGIAYRFQVEGVNRDLVLNPVARQNTYLIFKEAIHNVVRHSPATEVDITTGQRGQQLIVTVRDNGGPPRPSRAKEKSRGHGLENMQLRAGRMGAQLTTMHDAHGFAVHLQAPIF